MRLLRYVGRDPESPIRPITDEVFTITPDPVQHSLITFHTR